MALRPPLLQRTLSPVFSLSRGGPIAPRLLAPTSFIRPNSSDNNPTAPHPRSQLQPSNISLSNFLGDSILSRSKPVLRTDTDDDTIDTEFPSFIGSPSGTLSGASLEDNMFRLCVYATKHNTHITFTKPNKDIILAMSCGNVGFKKANRGTFEAAYQLASTVLSKMDAGGLKPKNLEIVFRDFGPGREAFTKVLLGKEGKPFRESVRRVTDATRLKFGGTRSRAVRRL